MSPVRADRRPVEERRTPPRLGFAVVGASDTAAAILKAAQDKLDESRESGDVLQQVVAGAHLDMARALAERVERVEQAEKDRMVSLADAFENLRDLETTGLRTVQEMLDNAIDTLTLVIPAIRQFNTDLRRATAAVRRGEPGGLDLDEHSHPSEINVLRYVIDRLASKGIR